MTRKRPPAGFSASSGMTLLELMVAVSIFGVIGSALYPVLADTLEGRRIATERVALDAEARRILDRLEQDLLANVDLALPPPAPPRFLAPPPPLSRSRGARVLLETTTLVTRGVTAADAFVAGEDVAALSVDRGDQAQVVWRFDADGRLLRQELRPPRTQPVDWERLPFEVLSERTSLALEFYEPETWIDRWSSADGGNQKGRAPVAVRTTLHIEDEDAGILDLVSTVILPVVETATDVRKPGRRR
jgi:prepilin-type N-terminal cleavage/methylation domain-containing protein